MRAFTLIETALVLLISILIFGITVSFNTFNRDFFYLRDVAKNLSVALNTVADLAQRITEKNNKFYCGAGIYFPDQKSFEVLAFATTTKLCEDVVTPGLIHNLITTNLSQKTYVLSNQDLTNIPSPPSLLLNTSLKPGYRIIFSNTPNCNSNYNPPLIFMYIYSYNDIFFVFQQGTDWQKIDVNEIYICLEKPGKESYIIKLNKLGQLSIVK